MENTTHIMGNYVLELILKKYLIAKRLDSNRQREEWHPNYQKLSILNVHKPNKKDTSW